MNNRDHPANGGKVSAFSRKFFEADEHFTAIGRGGIGGKAQGLFFIKDVLRSKIDPTEFPEVEIRIPTMTVLRTGVFDAFLKRNDLTETAYSDMPDDRIANAFQRAQFPAEFVGDLRALISKVNTPLAVRSSSLLEDAMYEPFAGVYGTKMIPNNQPDINTRFQKLIEAVKFVYASTFFKEAKAYARGAGVDIKDEKMAVIIQEVVGKRFGERYYPVVSGVARSYNFYAVGKAKPEHGVVNLALGLGKTIVDGGLSWSYSPALPRIGPPFGSVNELLKNSQTEFWAVNMGKPPAFDPIRESEYLNHLELQLAESDGSLRHIASTYDPASDRISPGVGVKGPRILNFAPILTLNEFPLNNVLKKLITVCEEAVENQVEIEFAINLDKKNSPSVDFGFLQVRPMVVSDEQVDITPDMFEDPRTLVVSESVLGNGINRSIQDVIYVKPETFEARLTMQIADEIEQMNLHASKSDSPYLLIGIGRWGSSESWLGIPVNWSQISGARAVVEATLHDMNVELSQGSHLFHNLTSFHASYFAVRHDRAKASIDWEWLDKQQVVSESEHVRHIRLKQPLEILVDGRSRTGIIFHE